MVWQIFNMQYTSDANILGSSSVAIMAMQWLQCKGYNAKVDGKRLGSRAQLLPPQHPTTDIDKYCKISPIHNQMGLQIMQYTSDANIQWLGSPSVKMVQKPAPPAENVSTYKRNQPLPFAARL